MDRQYQCGTQILVVVFLCLGRLSTGVRAQAPGEDVLDDFDRRIRSSTSLLDSIRTELRDGRKKLLELREAEGGAVTQLQQLQKNIVTTGRFLSELERSIDTVSAHVEVLGDSLQSARAALERRRETMMRRLRNMYKTGLPGHRVGMILAAPTFTEALYRIRYFAELSRYDRVLLARIDSTRERVRRHKESQEQKLKRLAALREEKRREQAVFREEKDSREELLADIRSQKERYLEMVSELEAAREEINSLIRRLVARKRRAEQELRRAETIAFGKRKGKLPWPVSGTVVKAFGRVVHPVYKTVTRSNGIDIQAPPGEQVRSVAPGVVAYTGRMRGLGRFLVVDHSSEYLTIYAHLQSVLVREEQEVDYATVLGTVGKGPLGESKLHFEIRKATAALDPGEWLEPRGTAGQ